MVKIHYKHPKEKGNFVYICNWAVMPLEAHMSRDLDKVTCKNCRKILNKVS